MSLVVALWPGPGGYATRDLLGKPVWERTLAATRGLGAAKTLWVRGNGKASDEPDGVDAVDARGLSSLSDTVLVLSGNTRADQAALAIQSKGIIPTYLCESVFT